MHFQKKDEGTVGAPTCCRQNRKILQIPRHAFLNKIKVFLVVVCAAL
jgi:hypothetical protein